MIAEIPPFKEQKPYQAFKYLESVKRSYDYDIDFHEEKKMFYSNFVHSLK